MSRAEQFYGAGKEHIDRMFPDGAPTTMVPWPQMGRRKDREDYDRGLVHGELSKPPNELALRPVDPRGLHATQPSILRQHVQHYLGDEYELHGRTSADQHMAGNAHPVVYRRAGLDGAASQDIILSGHHRAAAALLQGKELHARLIEGGYGPERGTGPASLTRATPRLRNL
jgi:hypothetical protein